ncbi:hypothetical protein I5770_09725 [Brucella sp. BO2]|uniref:hypothetical protein n=1 Tax=Brucella sp. BO2 TaxID=693750 RepID=UPI0012EAB152|nr:hypothetical protein [Brucella sp. BO2]QPN28847.1 hypothetical protein I5770_09725 [Brucella sp. BO2]
MSDKKEETRAFGVIERRGELCSNNPKLATSKADGERTVSSSKQEKPPARDNKR